MFEVHPLTAAEGLWVAPEGRYPGVAEGAHSSHGAVVVEEGENAAVKSHRYPPPAARAFAAGLAAGY